MDAAYWIIAVAIVLVLIVGGANIITASQKISPAFIQVQEETNLRCNACLQQFQSEGVSCTFNDERRVCKALVNVYCAMNCSVRLP